MRGRVHLTLSAAISCVVIAASHHADASRLQMVPSVESHVDEAAQAVALKWTVTNEGDESAQEVALDLPALNESHSLANSMAPQEKATVEVTIPFDRLGIQQRGAYGVFYRVLYKDANLYSFSAPYSTTVILPPAPTRVLSAAPDGFSEISLASRAAAAITAQNVTSIEANIDKLEPVAPVEIGIALRDAQLPIKLKPGERRGLRFDLTRSGALEGATYVVGALASGVAGDRHFAERISFTVRIVAPLVSGRSLMIAALAVVVAGTMLFWLWQRRRAIRA